MSDLSPLTDIRVSPEQLKSVLKLYEDGLYLQAYRLAEQFGPLANWRGAEARILAGRLAGNLGAPRMSAWHFIHAYRKDRTHPEALWFFARYLLGRRGSLAAWNFMRSCAFPQNAAPTLRSHWCSQHAAILGPLRDFDAAEDWLRRAEEIGPEPWTQLEWAMLYSLQDRNEDAEAAARRALEMRPWYRPAVQWVAHFLVQKERDAEALGLLKEASTRLESSAIHAQLAVLQLELGQLEDCARSLDEFQRLAPLLDKDQKQWLDGRRCDLACRAGDYAQALTFAKQIKGKVYEDLAKRLGERIALTPNPSRPGRGDGGEGNRVELPVGYVRQHHKTCAPATLTAIAKFWNLPAEHVEVAEEITYCGTPHHSERKWANEHGFFTKSFTVSWDAAVALIDRGIPFTLATTEVSSAHLQAVIGYDFGRGTLIIRDPGDRHKVEMPIDLALERYRATGPRGMALVPIAEKAKLQSLALPDEALYEHVFKFELALEGHRRADAGQTLQGMMTHYGQHFLTLYARRMLAYYDADLPAALSVTEELLRLFPGDLLLELSRTDLLRSLGRRDDRLEILKRLSEQKESDPACWQAYAQELAVDGRRQAQTLSLLRRAIRCTSPLSPLQGRLLDTLARVRWDQRRYDESLHLHHLAVCVDDTDEYLAQGYSGAGRAHGDTERVLQLLQKRFKRFGAKSSQPARTLYYALVQLERHGEAFDVLDEAMRLRPKDGELMTYVAEAHVYRGEFESAEGILAKAEGISKPAGRLRSLAYLAFCQGNWLKARDCWEEVLKIEPLAEDAHRNYCQYLSQQEGRPEAAKHLRAQCQRFPNHLGLARMLYEWLFEDGPAAREQALKALIHIDSANVASRIDYAYFLSDQDRADEAASQLDQAEQLDPHWSATWHARGVLAKKKQRKEDAMFAFREAIRYNADFEVAIHELIWQCETLQERRDAVAFIESELVRQSTLGTGINALHWAAQPVYPPDELGAILRRLRDERPELALAWSSVTRQLGYADREEERLANANKALKQFPTNHGLWLDLAEAQRVQKDADGELQSLERALKLFPSDIITIRMLAEAHERAGQSDKAKKVFEQAIRRAPLIAATYLDYAELLIRLDDYDAAFKQAQHALRIDPWFENAWSRICAWYIQHARFDDMVSLAREWTKKFPGEMRSWVRLAQAYQWQGPQTPADKEKERIDDCARAYDEALKRNSFARDIQDLKAEMLGLVQRFDEARAACNPAVWKGKVPLELRGRAAWIKAQEGDFDSARKQMAVLVKEDFLYQWGWNQLVEWSQASQDFSDYLGAAGEVLRRRTQSVLALTFRGEARIRMDEREVGIEDLRNAVRKDPCSIFACQLLFDEQMTDSNLVGAEATLSSMKQCLSYHHYEAREIQLAIKKEEKDKALAIFKRMAESAFTMSPSLDLAIRAFDLANWKEPADKILVHAMDLPNWNLHLAMLFGSGWNPNLANDLPDRIAAIDKALARQPQAFVFLDLKANLLASGNQFERAWQVCQAKVFPQDQVALDGRGAWVMFRSGNRHEAIGKMKELVRKYPKYMWGWYQLAEWYGIMLNWVECLTVAEQIVQLAPRDPTGYAHRGWAKQNLGDLTAAKADYTHAFDLSPTYIFAAWQLYELAMRNGDYRKAEKLLEKAKKHADPGEWALRKVDSLVAQNRKAQFPAEFENLLRNSAKAPWLVDQALGFLVQAGWWGDAEEVLHKCLDISAHICDPWVRMRVAMGDRRVGDDIQNMSTQRPERTNCVAAYAVELAYAKQAGGLRDWILSNEDGLRADTPAWGKVAGALYVIQDWSGIADWMADWADHAKATPGMVLTLVKALRSLGRIDEARKVSLHSLTKLNPDYASSFHKVWLMFDQALQGDMLPVQRYLDSSDLGGFDGYHALVAAMVRGLWWTTTDKQNGFGNARRLLGDAAKFAQPTIHDPALTRSYQQCIGQLAQLRGTFGAKLWRIWRWLFPKLPPIPKPPG